MGQLYEFLHVSLRRGSSWIPGVSRVEHDGVGGFSIAFSPSGVADSAHGFQLDIKEIGFTIAAGVLGENHFIRIDWEGTEKRKTCLLNFGNRAAAVRSVENAWGEARRRLDASKKSDSATVDGGKRSSASVLESGGKIQDDYFTKYCRGRNDEKLEQLLSAPTHESAKALNEEDLRLKLLQDDQESLELYSALVLDGIMSDEEFWDSRTRQLDELRAKVNQKHGLSSGLTANVQVNKTSQNSQQVELSDEQIDRIFLAYPKVDELYRQKVLRSKELSLEEFWLLFFYSKYNPENHLHGDDFHMKDKVIEASRVFGDWDEEENSETPKIHSLSQRGQVHDVEVDPSVNLLQSLYDDMHGTANELAAIGMSNHSVYGIAKRDVFAEKRKDDKTKKTLQKLGRKVRHEDLDNLVNATVESTKLFSHYNQHASTVLPDQTGHPEVREGHLRRAKEQEKTAECLDDLMSASSTVNKQPGTISLDIDESRYDFVDKSGNPNADRGDLGQSDGVVIKREDGGLRKWNPLVNGLSNVFPDSKTSLCTLQNIVEASIDGSMDGLDSRHLANSLEDIPDSDELVLVTQLCNELRSRFWKSFPPSIRATVDFKKQQSVIELEKIVSALNQCEERARDFREYARNKGKTTLANLLHDTLAQLKKATDDWGKWVALQERKRLQRQSRG